jgi:hypothetical protein
MKLLSNIEVNREEGPGEGVFFEKLVNKNALKERNKNRRPLKIF